MAAAERPATRTRGRRPGFDLEQLPTTYTNKCAIFGAQDEKGEEEERSHHGKYLALWVRAGWRGSWRVTTV